MEEAFEGIDLQYFVDVFSTGNVKVIVAAGAFLALIIGLKVLSPKFPFLGQLGSALASLFRSKKPAPLPPPEPVVPVSDIKDYLKGPKQ